MRHNIYTLQSRSVAEEDYIKETCRLPHAGFLLGLLFNPEDVDDMFLRNVC
jgi:hypothetical protein